MAKKALTKTEVNKWNRVNADLIKSDAKLALERQVQNVMKNVQTLNARKVKASIVLCQYYSARAKELFRRFQTHNSFWNNQTYSAYANVFTAPIIEDNIIGFLIAHGVDYGVYLELANNRKHEALWPIIKDIEPDFLRDLKELW